MVKIWTGIESFVDILAGFFENDEINYIFRAHSKYLAKHDSGRELGLIRIVYRFCRSVVQMTMIYRGVVFVTMTQRWDVPDVMETSIANDVIGR